MRKGKQILAIVLSGFLAMGVCQGPVFAVQSGEKSVQAMENEETVFPSEFEETDYIQPEDEEMIVTDETAAVGELYDSEEAPPYEGVPQGFDSSQQEDLPQGFDRSQQEDLPQGFDRSQQEDLPQGFDSSQQEDLTSDAVNLPQEETVEEGIETDNPEEKESSDASEMAGEEKEVTESIDEFFEDASYANNEDFQGDAGNEEYTSDTSFQQEVLTSDAANPPQEETVEESIETDNPEEKESSDAGEMAGEEKEVTESTDEFFEDVPYMNNEDSQEDAHSEEYISDTVGDPKDISSVDDNEITYDDVPEEFTDTDELNASENDSISDLNALVENNGLDGSKTEDNTDKGAFISGDDSLPGTLEDTEESVSETVSEEANNSVYQQYLGTGDYFNQSGGDYRYWSHGTSTYWMMREYGCWITAMAKLIYETGVDRSSSFNPDRMAEWLVNNGYVYNLTDNLKYKGNYSGALPQYAAEHYPGGEIKIEWAGVMDYPTYDDIWRYINTGFFTILKVNDGHYVYIDNEMSKKTGEIYVDDSYKDNYAPGPVLFSSKTGYSLIQAQVYWKVGGGNTSSKPTNPTLTINKTRFTASDTIYLQAHADGATNYYGAIYKQNTRIWEGNCLEGGVIQYPANQFGSGEYSAYVTCSNNTGWVDSNWVSYSVTEDMGDSFYAFIILTKDWRHLGLSGRNVQIPSANDCFDPRQIWRFEKQSDGSYIAYNMYMSGYDNSEWVLTCRNGGKTNGTNIEVEKNKRLASQKWFIYVYNNEYKLVPTHCSLTMDVAGGSSSSGTNIQLYESNDTCWQRFCVYKLSYDNATYTRPGRPSASSYTGVTEADAGEAVNLTWSNSPKVNEFDKRSYRLQIFDSDNNEFYSQSGLTGTNYSFSFGRPGTYSIQITAVNDNLMGVETTGSKTKVTIRNDNPLTVKKSPSSVTVEEGAAVRLTAVASGYGLKYQWYMQRKGSTEWEKADSQSAILSVTADSSVDGAKFKCVFTDQYGDTAESDAATITISKPDLPEEKTQITAQDVKLSKTSYIYDGIAKKPKVTVACDDETLILKTDYTVSYKNNLNAGTATVIVTGKGDYTGTVKKTFKITAASITEASITGLKTRTYTGKALVQAPVVELDDLELEKDVDYTVSYNNNINAGTATVIITGKGNYASRKTATFKINKAVQSITAKAAESSVAVGKTTTVSITGAKGTKSFKSSDTTTATVTSAGKVTAKKVGTVKITATSAATANYKAASKTVTIKVVPAATTSLTAANQVTGIKLTWKMVAGANGYKVYRGSTLIKTITSGSTVTYADAKANTNGTKYTYKVVAKASTGDSTLSKSVAVYRVARPAVSSVTNSVASKMTVKWGKNAKATGYQIQYSLSSSFASGNKTATITTASTISKVIGSLTKGKTYYVRIRSYKTVGSTKYWSTWSTSKSVKISK